MPRFREEPTRVVYFSDAPYSGGAERYLIRLAQGLDRSRYDPRLLLPDRRELDEVAALAEAARLPVQRYAPESLAGLGGFARLEERLRTLAPDLVHLNLPNPYHALGGWAAAAARRAGARAVVTTEHIADIPAARRRALLKRLSLRWVARVVTISRTHARLLAARHGVPAGKIRVVYNGVEDPGPPALRPAAPVTLLCVGQLEPRKGQDLLIEALPRWRDAGHDVRLVLVGDGPARGELEARAAALGVTHHVRFTGRLPSAADELARAHLLVAPSRIEGLPFTLLEGMAAGACVVASALPGLEEAVDTGVTGVLLAPGALTAWVDGVAALLDDRARLDRLAAAGRERFLERFTLERMVRETMAVYDEALG